MAKQTLDLYELFRLVVSKGGLVEVINKKLWREITKGLNLPSSITSAAFTLRTQYMKYLYPYECDKLKLSSPNELQTAIDGNRREGRRPSYGYDFSPVPTMIPTGPPLTSGPPPPMSHLNGALLNGRPDIGSSAMSVGFPLQVAYGAVDLKLSNGCCSSGEDENSVPASTQLHLRTLAERDARAMEAAARAMEEATNRMSEASRSTAPTSVTPIVSLNHHHRSMLSSQKMEPPPKRMTLDEDRLAAHMGMPSAHLKITSRNDGRAEFDNSLVVSMEINGIMYQGVLFAQHPRRI
ncbi:hypothetical protein LSAT2_007295 [Lamellibrachia satsuma]|nr:hypothetical protein LSAT2_007295 [Lamellibrachia satsuma]